MVQALIRAGRSASAALATHVEGAILGPLIVGACNASALRLTVTARGALLLACQACFLLGQVLRPAQLVPPPASFLALRAPLRAETAVRAGRPSRRGPREFGRLSGRSSREEGSRWGRCRRLGHLASQAHCAANTLRTTLESRELALTKKQHRLE